MHVNSNNPISIIKLIIKTVATSVSWLLTTEEIFQQQPPYYNEMYIRDGHKNVSKYQNLTVNNWNANSVE